MGLAKFHLEQQQKGYIYFFRKCFVKLFFSNSFVRMLRFHKQVLNLNYSSVAAQWQTNFIVAVVSACGLNFSRRAFVLIDSTLLKLK